MATTFGTLLGPFSSAVLLIDPAPYGCAWNYIAATKSASFQTRMEPRRGMPGGDCPLPDAAPHVGVPCVYSGNFEGKTFFDSSKTFPDKTFSRPGDIAKMRVRFLAGGLPSLRLPAFVLDRTHAY